MIYKLLSLMDLTHQSFNYKAMQLHRMATLSYGTNWAGDVAGILYSLRFIKMRN